MNDEKQAAPMAASEARYRSILEASPDGIAITDLGGRVTMLSARAVAMLRAGRESEVIGRPITDFIVPEDRSRALERIGLLFAGKSTGPGEYRGLRTDGSTFDIDVNAEFIADQSGAPAEILFMVRDVSERTEAREALQRSNVLLRSIIETAPARIFWKDKDLRYLGCNTEFARDAGVINPADVVGRTDLEMPWKEQAEQYRADDRAVMESGLPKMDYEEPQTNPSGDTFWLGTSKVPLRDDAGAVVGILGIYQDITVRKLAGDALRESLNEKESLLKEVHHRVKNNLQVINSLLRLEAGRSKEPAVRQALGEMQGRVLSMAVLHETLYRTRTFGRVDLAPYLKELARQFFKAHASGDAPPKLTLDLSHVEVSVDQGVPCGLILSELMSNSFKYAFGAKPGGEVRVVLRREPNREVLLQVSDNGPGLPGDFEARRTRSLGMQLVADLARQIGGRMEIGPGPGACFNVRFASATGERRRPGRGARQP
ncbi:MAG: PAS domain S-box protein [Vicinamibacteria bacterium]|nr:PAS domain S-box protein [Vicinamibacteria bacterium]